MAIDTRQIPRMKKGREKKGLRCREERCGEHSDYFYYILNGRVKEQKLSDKKQKIF
jgi:CRP-like cAMP-binding protein